MDGIVHFNREHEKTGAEKYSNDNKKDKSWNQKK